MGHGMHGTVPPSLTASAGRRSRFGRLALARTARTNVLCPECRTGPLIFSSRSAPPASFRVIPSIVHRGAIRVVPQVVCLEPCVGADCRGSRRVTGCTRWSGRAARLRLLVLLLLVIVVLSIGIIVIPARATWSEGERSRERHLKSPPIRHGRASAGSRTHTCPKEVRRGLVCADGARGRRSGPPPPDPRRNAMA